LGVRWKDERRVNAAAEMEICNADALGGIECVGWSVRGGVRGRQRTDPAPCAGEDAADARVHAPPAAAGAGACSEDGADEHTGAG
jgi:hypothetical protein